MDFEWDKNKEAINRKKHGVSFHEASTVFSDPFAITFADPDHSPREQRLLTFGYSVMNRLLVVVHTYRNGQIRIISSRKTTRRERVIYENG
jgi:uncharacterized protein